MKVEAVVLEGIYVRLEPLKIEHFDRLCAVGLEESLWRWIPTVIESKDDLRRYVEMALGEFERKVSLPFVTIGKSANKIVGSTRFGNIDVSNRKAEIGWTWINPDWQRTFINTEAKLLMLTHAFETWKTVRVEFKTDALNEKSRNAILRLGAKEEGIFRQNLFTGSGRLRDTVYYSILDSEWNSVRENLQTKLKGNY